MASSRLETIWLEALEKFHNNALNKLEKAGLLAGDRANARREALSANLERSDTLADQLINLDQQGLLMGDAGAKREAALLAKPQYAISLANGLLMARQQGLITGESGAWRENALIADPEHAYWLALGFNILKETGHQTEEREATLVKNIDKAERDSSLGATLKILFESGLLSGEAGSKRIDILIANPQHAESLYKIFHILDSKGLLLLSNSEHKLDTSKEEKLAPREDSAKRIDTILANLPQAKWLASCFKSLTKAGLLEGQEGSKQADTLLTKVQDAESLDLALKLLKEDEFLSKADNFMTYAQHAHALTVFYTLNVRLTGSLEDNRVIKREEAFIERMQQADTLADEMMTSLEKAGLLVNKSPEDKRRILDSAGLLVAESLTEGLLALEESGRLEGEQGQKNFDTFIEYAQFAKEISQELKKHHPITQEIFNKLIQDNLEKMQVALLMGLHPRLGENSAIGKVFRGSAIADRNVFSFFNTKRKEEQPSLDNTDQANDEIKDEKKEDDEGRLDL